MKTAFASGSAERVDVGVGWVPQANPFQRQWHATPLIQSPTDKSAVTVDLSKLQGLTPLAARLAWVLFDEPDQTADTCCPGHAAQVGRAVCLPGNCPLYSATSELPANPFCKSRLPTASATVRPGFDCKPPRSKHSCIRQLRRLRTASASAPRRRRATHE